MSAQLTAVASMLIRKPVAEVFAAFVDPALTAHFWFTRGSGRLEPGAQVTWHWDMYGISSPVSVRVLTANRRIVIDWGEERELSTVEWLFSARPDGTTFVQITNRGFQGDDDAVLAQAVGATEAFTLVLAGAKAWLEHGLRLNLIADKFPDGLPKG